MNTEDRKYFIHDYESGTSYEVTKEHYERYQAMRNLFLVNTGSLKSRIQITGTMSDDNDNYSFRSLFESVK